MRGHRRRPPRRPALPRRRGRGGRAARGQRPPGPRARDRGRPPVRPQRGARLLRGDRPAGRAHLRDARRRGRPRAERRRRVLRRGQDAGHGRSEPRGRGRPGVVQGHDLGQHDHRAAVRRGVHGRARRAPDRPPADRPCRAARRAALGPRRRRGLGQVGLRLAMLLRHAGIPVSRSTTARRARTSVTRASAACRSSSGAGRTRRSSSGCPWTARSRSRRSPTTTCRTSP